MGGKSVLTLGNLMQSAPALLAAWGTLLSLPRTRFQHKNSYKFTVSVCPCPAGELNVNLAWCPEAPRPQAPPPGLTQAPGRRLWWKATSCRQPPRGLRPVLSQPDFSSKGETCNSLAGGKCPFRGLPPLPAPSALQEAVPGAVLWVASNRWICFPPT